MTLEITLSAMNIGDETLPSTVIVAVLPFEILVRNQIWSPADDLNIAKWEDAWDDLTGEFQDDFIENLVYTEPDRFRIRIKTDELPDSLHDIFISTVGAAEPEYNDDATKIVLEYDPGAPELGIPSQGFLSKPIIMVSDTVDNDFNSANIEDDQTHIVALGGNVEFRGNDPGGDIARLLPVKGTHEVSIAVILLWQGTEGPSPAVMQIIADDIKVASEILSQVGVSLSLSISSSLVTLPEVDLSDGLSLDTQTKGVLDAEGEDVLDFYATPDVADVICLYVDGRIRTSSSALTDTVPGIAISDNTETVAHSNFPVYWSEPVSDKFKGTFFVDVSRDSKATFSHELGHVLSLLHLGQEKAPNTDTTLARTRNVMFGNGTTYRGLYQDDSKRLRIFQEQRTHSSQFVTPVEE